MASATTGIYRVTLTAPAVVPAYRPFIVKVDVDPVLTIVAPNGTVTPGTGHFHLFVDRPPLVAGAFVPQDADIVHSITKNTRILGLDPGPHTITATIGDGADRVLADAPPVSVTVRAR